MSEEDDKKRRLRAARRALSNAQCTCADGKHDKFWIRCPRTIAETNLDDALASLGVEL